MPAAGTSLPYWPHAASGESSRKAVASSSTKSMRSRTSSLPRARWRWMCASRPPVAASASRSRRSL